MTDRKKRSKAKIEEQKDAIPVEEEKTAVPVEESGPPPADDNASESVPVTGTENDSGENGEANVAELSASSNSHLRRILDRNFLEYASYVIKDRAIPDINDGFKPVQRRIIWSLYRIDDGRFHKVANVIGHSMQYHPHGDQSIYGALVVLANKEYYIDKQGNFGNIFTGDDASAARYIECRLTPLAKETLFNNDITEFTDSYDGRNKEPVYLPVKIPSLLMLGHEGIAPGMTTRILSHNFKELLCAQIAILQNEPYEIYPDFLQGGTMDVSEYNDGEGKITLRAKIDVEGRKLIIREIPPFCTTESLIASIERAVNKSKIKIAAINDYTGETVEIELTPARGYEPQKALNALYAYTDCSISVTSNILVIKDNRPVQMKVSEVLKYNTEKLLEYLKAELEIELGKLNEKFHEKTLAQIFIENRIYKRIEECESNELVFSEVRKGLNKFKNMLKREITDDDIEKLLGIPIRRISLFDINKNKKDLDDIVQSIAEVEKNLKRMKAYAIRFLKNLIEKYGKLYPRKTEIVKKFDKIDVKAVALNNIKVGWDKKNCFIGTSVKSDDTITCNEFDKLLCVEKNSTYKIIGIPEKAFVGRLFYFCKYDKDLLFNIVYKDKASDLCYAKRSRIPKFITDKEYNIAPEGSKLEIINTRSNYIYECIFEPIPRQKQKSVTLDFSQVPEKGTQARGIRIASKKIIDFKFIGASEEAPAPGSENQDLPTGQEPAPETATEDEKMTPEPAPEEKTKKTEKPEKQEKAEEKLVKQERARKPEKESEEPVEEPEPSKRNPGKNEKVPEKIQKSTKPAKEAKPAKEDGKKTEDQLEFNIFPEGNPTKDASLARKSQKGGKPAPPLKKSNPKNKNNSEDEWGISQPELGF